MTTCCKGDIGDTKRFATGRNLMWMVSIQLSIQGKQKEPLQCYPTSTQPWTSVCWWMLWLTGDSSRWMHWKRLHLSSLKPVQRDGKVAYPCSCVPGCASRPSYIWMKLFQEENCWRSMALNIKKKKACRKTPFCSTCLRRGSQLTLEHVEDLWTGNTTEKKPNVSE